MKYIRVVGFALLLTMTSVHAADVEATVTNSAGKPVADAAIVLEAVSGNMPQMHPLVTIAQRDRELVPYVTIVQTNTSIEFPNQDPFKHHLYSFSPAKTFEIKLYAGKPAQPVVFDKVGEVALGCNIHDWMEAYVLVVDSPYFAKTDAKGRARIADIPAGAYRLKWWHPRQQRQAPTRTIEIGNAPPPLTQVLNVKPRILKPKPPVDADRY